MSFWHNSIIGAFVPSLVKKAVPFIAKKFKLAEFDAAARERVSRQNYPKHYVLWYGLWGFKLVMSGFVVFGAFFIAGIRFPESFGLLVLMGIVNMVGAWLLLGGLINAALWRVSSEHFQDYVRFRQIKSGTGYVIEQQIWVLIKIGIIYYIVLLPVMLGLLIFGSNKMEQEALRKIKALPEVAAFVSELEQNGKKASFRVEDQGNEWGIQVYEIVARDGESHTATFNWYRVNKKSGAVDKEF
ncbi:MAG: hypothetical protein U1A23_01540 [Candidatus Sungbacteria bacterium]|nr:hypothetical protein [bacterium]MDZ4285589.1 hypothetical protein [Candidatus Sungbacteria bacterium]